MQPKRVLIIEDDADAAGVLEAYLKRENYEVMIAGDGPGGLDAARRWQPDLILLDIMLPGMNGTEVLAALRRRDDTPVIMVTAMGDAPDRIGALRYGADDYVVKPYHPGEVVARVQAVLRRSQQSQVPAAETLRWAGLVVDPVALTAVVDSDSASPRRLDLTPTEFSLLVTLMRAPTRPFTRLFLLEHCLPESDALERVVDTHVYNLRRKLEAAGMRFAASVTGSDSHEERYAYLTVALDLHSGAVSGDWQRGTHRHLYVAALRSAGVLGLLPDAARAAGGVHPAAPPPCQRSGTLSSDYRPVVGYQLLGSLAGLVGLADRIRAGGGHDPVYGGDGAAFRPSAVGAVQPASDRSASGIERGIWPNGGGGERSATGAGALYRRF
ncbi:MAG: DNA-binding response regulator [Pantoea agglomerans]|nr:DNA-binding response regulator [Pantoea agglomerans]